MAKRPVSLRWAAIAAVVAVLCWFFGADVWHSALIAGVVTALGLVLSVRTPGGDAAAGQPPPGGVGWQAGSRPNRRGSRSDVKELSWSMRGSYGQVGSRALRRAQQLARRRLAAHQLDLHDRRARAEIERLIGGRAYLVLTRGDRRPPLLRSFVKCLDALDALVAPAPPTRSTDRPPGTP